MAWTPKHNIDHEETIDGITYKVVKTKEEADTTIDFMLTYMRKDEPVCQSRGGLQFDHEPSLVQLLQDVLVDGVGLVAIDSVSGRLAGVRVAKTIKRPDAQVSRDTLESLESHFPRDFARMMYMFNQLGWAHDIFEAHPGDQKMYDMFGLCTHPDFRGRGIAQNMVAQSFKVARKAGCDCVMVSATSDISRHIFDKFGMKRLGHINLEEFKIDGEVYFAGTKSQGLTAFYYKL